MTPLHYLMVKSDASPAELAKAILAAGERFGAATPKLTGADLRRWHSSGRRMPLWASAAVVVLAIEAGWPVESAEERDWAVRGWRAAHPESDVDALAAALASPVDRAALAASWKNHERSHDRQTLAR